MRNYEDAERGKEKLATAACSKRSKNLQLLKWHKPAKLGLTKQTTDAYGLFLLAKGALCFFNLFSKEFKGFHFHRFSSHCWTML
jgi:hypothetical protein